MTKPPIQDWWPHLSIPSKHSVLAEPDQPLTSTVLAEIVHITGVWPDRLDEPYELDDEERAYIAQQSEIVD